MGNKYEAGAQCITTAAATDIATILTAAGSRAIIREVGISAVTAVAGEVGIGYPAANGATSAGAVLGQALDKADTASVTSLVRNNAGAGWTTHPTAPTVPMRRFQLPAVIGAGVVWVWEPGELIVPISSNFVIWQFSTAIVTYDVYVKWSE
jgi:hypothetical protein